jgi:hypothetical protein
MICVAGESPIATNREGYKYENSFIGKKDVRLLQDYPASRQSDGDLQPVEKA